MTRPANGSCRPTPAAVSPGTKVPAVGSQFRQSVRKVITSTARNVLVYPALLPMQAPRDATTGIPRTVNGSPWIPPVVLGRLGMIAAAVAPIAQAKIVRVGRSGIRAVAHACPARPVTSRAVVTRGIARIARGSRWTLPARTDNNGIPIRALAPARTPLTNNRLIRHAQNGIGEALPANGSPMTPIVTTGTR
jgi:hypothetical protein